MLKKKSRIERSISFLWWGILPSLVSIAILWYPFGFAMGGMLEDWEFFDLANREPSYWNSFPGHTFADLSAARPFQLTPFIIAKALTPHSFAGSHLFLMLACALKVISAISVGYYLFRNRRIALAIGLLTLVFPADTQQMSLRTMNISLAGGFMLSGVALFIRGILGSTITSRRVAIVLSMILCVVASLIYEPFIPYYIFPALFILARSGFHGTTVILKRRWKLISLWSMAPFASAIYLFYAIVIFKTSYQNALASGGILHSLRANFRYLWESGAYRIFFDAWRSTAHILFNETLRYGYIALVFFIVFALLWLAVDSKRPQGTVRKVRIVIAGLFACIAGYLPFMTDVSHALITQRTFMGAAPGAALVIAGAISFAWDKRTKIGSVILAVVISLGFVQQLYQFDRYTRDYISRIRPYTSYLADTANKQKKFHLVLDSSGMTAHLTGLYYSTVNAGPKVRMHEAGGAFFLCKNAPPSRFAIFGQCSLKNGIWTIINSADGLVKLRASDVETISIDQSFDQSYRSHRDTWQDFSMLSENNPLFITPDSDLTRYDCKADSMWGYSSFCRGEGWSDGIFNHTGFSDQNWFGSISPNASLIFPLRPVVTKSYILSLHLFGGLDDAVVRPMKVTVNGNPVLMKLIGKNVLQATVSMVDLRTGQNVIAFHNVLPSGRDLGLLVSRIQLKPSL